MAESTPDRSGFVTPAGVPLVAAFDGGRLTSDGGLPWLAEADGALALCATLARCIPDWRRGPVIHTLETLVRQRVFQIACGYEDQDDADSLRTDPLLKLVCGRLPDSGIPLASQPTLSRLENHISRHTAERLATALVDLYVHARSRQGPPGRILLYFDQHMYHPLLVFDGDTGHLITAALRPGNVHGSRFAVWVLRRVVRRLRQAWPEVVIELRADSGFAVPRLYTWCEANAVLYTIGLVPNPVLERLAAPLLAEAQAQSAAQAGAKVRLVEETTYQAGSWPTLRRVVYKAEVLAQGPNTRFVVTTQVGPPQTIYDTYVDRGQAEN